jgi:hypothetical protein
MKDIADDPGAAGRWLDHLSAGLIAAAAILPMLAGSGVSQTARTAFAILAALALMSAVLAMSARGVWRLVPAVILLVPFLLALIGVAQLMPGLSGVQAGLDPSVTPRWQRLTDPPRILSAVPWATWQSILQLVAAGLVAVSAAHQFQTVRQVRWLTATIAIVLLGSLALGGIQAMTNNRRVFALLPATDKRLPAIARDTFTRDSAVGLAAYRPWAPASGLKQEETSIWQEPVLAPEPLFAGFLAPGHWFAVTAGFLPMLLVISLVTARRARNWNGRPDWIGTGDGRLSLMAFAAALVLAGGAGYFGETAVAALVIVSVMIATALLASAPGLWFTLVGRCLLTGGVAVGAALWKIRQVGGVPLLMERLEMAKADSLSMLAAFREHAVTGSGLGSFGALWPAYRSAAAEENHAGSSLLAFAVETGALGPALVGLAAIFCLLRWQWLRGGLDEESRMLTGGALVGLAGLLIASAAGAGLDTLAVPALAALLLGLAARGLAGGRTPWIASPAVA